MQSRSGKHPWRLWLLSVLPRHQPEGSCRHTCPGAGFARDGEESCRKGEGQGDSSSGLSRDSMCCSGFPVRVCPGSGRAGSVCHCPLLSTGRGEGSVSGLVPCVVHGGSADVGLCLLRNLRSSQPLNTLSALGFSSPPAGTLVTRRVDIIS